jgi:transposase-like protein
MMQGKKISIEEEKQILDLYAEGKGSVVIGRQLSLSYATVLRVLRKKGVERRHIGGDGGSRTPLTTNQKKRIIRLYGKLTMKEIGKRTGVSSNAIYRVLHQYDVEMRPAGCRPGRGTDERR